MIGSKGGRIDGRQEVGGKGNGGEERNVTNLGGEDEGDATSIGLEGDL